MQYSKCKNLHPRCFSSTRGKQNAVLYHELYHIQTPQAQERHEPVEAGLEEERHKNSQRVGAPLL